MRIAVSDAVCRRVNASAEFGISLLEPSFFNVTRLKKTNRNLPFKKTFPLRS